MVKIKKKSKFLKFVYVYQFYIVFYIILIIVACFLFSKLFGHINFNKKDNNKQNSISYSTISSQISSKSEGASSKEDTLSSTETVSSNNVNTITNVSTLKGTFSYGNYVSFTFDGAGSGNMKINEKKEYKFDYTVEKEKLILEFKSDNYSEKEIYNFYLTSKNRLVLDGVNGTKGKYELIRRSMKK